MRKLKSLLLVVVILFIVAAVMPIKAFAATAANEQEIVTVELRDRNMYEVLKKAVTCIGNERIQRRDPVFGRRSR